MPEFEEYPEPSCVNCGFLAVRTVGDEVWIAGRQVREQGWANLQTFCWRYERTMRDEIVDFGRNALDSPVEAWQLQVIRRHRSECDDKYHEWVPLWSLGEHLAEQRVYSLEKQRRKWETSQEEQRRRWESSFRNHWLPLVVAVAGIIVAAVIGVWATWNQTNATTDATAPIATPSIGDKSGAREWISHDRNQQRLSDDVSVVLVLKPPVEFVEVGGTMPHAQVVVGTDDGAFQDAL